MASNRPTSIYFLGAEDFPDRVKIGSADDPRQRLATLQTGSPSRLKLLAVMENVQRQTERSLHLKFKKQHIRGEWFHLNDEIEELIRLHSINRVRPKTTPLLHAVAANVRRRRLELDLSQDALAQQAGVLLRTVQRIEAGDGGALQTIVAIAKTLGASIDELIAET